MGPGQRLVILTTNTRKLQPSVADDVMLTQIPAARLKLLLAGGEEKKEEKRKKSKSKIVEEVTEEEKCHSVFSFLFFAKNDYSCVSFFFLSGARIQN